VGKQGVAVGRRLFLLPSFISIVSGHAKTFHVAIVNLSLRDDSMKKDAAYWIEKLCLERHPEGGYYRQSYKAALILAKESLPPEFTGARAASTAIYLLFEGENFSAFHRLRSDEVWHFYVGSTLVVHVIDQHGRYSEILLGGDPEAGEALQAVVKVGCWFASRVQDGKGFALVGCTVAPGFEFEDFEMGKREELARSYPQHRRVIEMLTRE
jgi:predicted cupin superfamily sugar epimerase